jgi:hypothetical protein
MIVVKITAVPLALALQLSPFLKAGRWSVKRLVLAGALWLPAVAWTLYYNHLRTGSPLKFPYGDINTFFPGLLFRGLVQSLVDPSRGLLLFNPILVILAWYVVSAFRSPLKWEVGLLTGAFAVTLVRISGTEYWHGGYSWGARYYTPFLVLFSIVAFPGLVAKGRLSAGWGVILLTAAGGVINLSGLLTNWHYRCTFPGEVDPSKGVFYGWPTLEAVCALGRNLWRSVGGSVPLDVVAGASDFNVQASNSLYVWWLNLRFVGVPVAVCLLLGSCMVTAVVYLAVRAAAECRNTSPPHDRRQELAMTFAAAKER